MDFLKELDSGWVQIKDLDYILGDCRLMADKLGFTIGWYMTGFTAVVRLRNAHGIVWQQKYSSNSAHMAICLMYAGVHTELKRVTDFKKAEAQKMKQLEEERAAERKIMNMPSMADRYKKH